MIGLVEFLKAAGVAIKDGAPKSVKIHLACWTGAEHPIDAYYAGEFKQWQESQSRRNFECNQILSLIDLGRNNWLFVGVYEVHRPARFSKQRFYDSTSLLPNQNDLIGRTIVHHQRSRATYIWYKPEVDLPLVELLREKMTIQEFPGYHSVLLTLGELKVITGQKIASWHGALANIKGVYLITDTTTGKHYVGKASGRSGIWQRWCAYAKNGHGGNVELKKLLKQRGASHMANLQYSVLEIADTHASDDDVIARESHWIDVLRSRDSGL